MIPRDWYYLPGGKKSHIVLPTALQASSMQSAVCGAQVLALLPDKVRWQHDPEGLAERDHCASCSRYLESERRYHQALGLEE